MAHPNHLALAKLIADGTLISMSKFVAQFEDVFRDAGFVNKKGKIDHKRVAEYYGDTYKGLIKVNDKKDEKDEGEDNKPLNAIQYQISTSEKLEEIAASKRTHLVTLMNAHDKTCVPPDTFNDFNGDYPLAGSHLWPPNVGQRMVFVVLNAADSPARCVLKYSAEIYRTNVNGNSRVSGSGISVTTPSFLQGA